MATPPGGFSVGCAVDVKGKLGQLTAWLPDEQQWRATLVTGESVDVPPASVKWHAKPGCDALIGPECRMDTLAEEVARCLFSKGYCVLKVCQSSEDNQAAFDYMNHLAEGGVGAEDGEEGEGGVSKLKRLPTEVEEGYLGVGGRGRVKFLDGDEDDLTVDPTIRKNDKFLSQLVYGILPYSSDVVGGIADHRTPGLLSVWLKDAELTEYPSPFPDDATLSTFLNTYDRSLLKAVHFMGPGNITVKFSAKGDTEFAIPLENAIVQADPNTILLYKTTLVDMAVSSDKKSQDTPLTLSVTFMKADTKPDVVGRWDAPETIAITERVGSVLESHERSCVENLSSRLAASMDDAEFYRAALAGGCDTAIEFQRSRFNWEEYYWPDVESAQPWHIVGRHTGFCEGLELFDCKYFNIPAIEAHTMDPMQRHLLETGAMNMYQLGYDKKHCDRNPHHGGCAVGLDKDDWTVLEKAKDLPDACKPTGKGSPNVQAIISNRFSFVYNLRGMNYVGDTACSASLAATHLASFMMKDRKNDKLEFFICMGLHQCLSCALYIGSHYGHMITTKGRCWTYDQTADGYMRSDGCSGLTLQWESENDHKMATWRGSAGGQNGRSATLTAPNGIAQEDVIKKAMVDAAIEPPETAIWSNHGTGTSLGDPIELGAVRKVQRKHERAQTLIIGTNKTNTGHLEGGAAMTSLVAAVIQVHLGRANAVCHLRVLNPHLEGIEIDGFYNTELNSTRLQQTNMQVSSFGFGGTNMHAVIHGIGLYNTTDQRLLFMRKLRMLTAPEVRPIGKNPATWETDGLDRAARPGDQFSITITKGDETKAAKYVCEQHGLGDDYDVDNVYYSIVGNFTNWQPVKLENGDVTGSRCIVVEIPRNGEIEFKFVNTLDNKLILAPDTEKCRSRTRPIKGPAVDLKNTWLIAGDAGTELRIDLFTSRGIIAVNWVEVESFALGPILQFSGEAE